MQSNSAVSVCLCPWEVPFPALLVVWGLCLAGCVQPCCHPATALPGTHVAHAACFRVSSLRQVQLQWDGMFHSADLLKTCALHAVD